MELKPGIITALLIIFFILSLPNSSQGLVGGLPDSANLQEEVYEIDYRGPETHSSVPPPMRSRSCSHDHNRGRGCPMIPHHDERKAHARKTTKKET